MTGWRKSFVWGLVLRTGAVLVAALALAVSIAAPGLVAVPVVAAILLFAAIYQLWRHIMRTNRAVGQFLDAVEHSDWAQRFAGLGRDSGFDELGRALDATIVRARDAQVSASEEARFLSALLDDAPTPLLRVEGDFVEPLNKAARRMFAGAEAGPPSHFAAYGPSFEQALTQLAPGESQLVLITLDGVRQSAVMTAASVQRLHGGVRILSVQPVQGTLDAVELAAQSDLVRVLTHEIMNSLTPVTSLAETASTLMHRLDPDDEDGREAKMAVDALARRARGVMHFVESYRTLAEPPRINLRTFDAGPWLRDLAAAHRAGEAGAAVPLTLDIAEGPMRIEADPDYLGQVVLNLMKNAAQAAAAHVDAPETRLKASLTRTGRLRLTVEDNGPGIAKALRTDVFLPFFTTKADGSGIGLSLARQIVMAHGGTIEVADAAGGGAAITCLI